MTTIDQSGGGLTITHDAEAGTVIDGTARGDGSAVVLRRAGWRWSRTLGAWYVPRSRDRRADRPLIDRTVQLLSAAGFAVHVTIADTLRPAAQVETDRIRRQQQRAGHLAERADRAHEQAARAAARADELTGRLPLGQPILAGHHSEPAMRRHAARLREATQAAVTAQERADQARHRADTAAAATGARHDPITVANRIRDLTARQRQLQHRIDGHTRTIAVLPDGTRHTETTPPARGDGRGGLDDELARLTDQLTYWQQIRADQIAAGAATDHGPDTINPGDLVRIRGQWYRVLRINRATVRIEGEPGMNNTTPTTGSSPPPIAHRAAEQLTFAARADADGARTRGPAIRMPWAQSVSGTTAVRLC